MLSAKTRETLKENDPFLQSSLSVFIRMLRCLWKEGADIALVPGEDIPLGRRVETLITDLKCPRHHLDIRYDPKSKTALVKAVSKRKAFAVNGGECKGNGILKEGDTLHILPGKLGYRLERMAGQEKSGWIRVTDDVMVYSDGSEKGSEKIAGFDLDGTLIVTKSGRVFPKDVDDWRIAFPSVPEKLKRLRKDGYRVVIFSNQKGISKGNQSADEFRRKLERILEKLGAGVVSACFVSPGEGFYRKPSIGMWEEMEKNYNAGVTVDRGKCLYVGDAAGRNTSKGKDSRKDHSCSDRLFAINLGVKFVTPEEFFLDQPSQPFSLPAFSPKQLLEGRAAIAPVNPPESKLAPANGKKEVIVLVGYPASGKTGFYKNNLEQNGYAHVSRDLLKTWQKCVQATEKYLKSGGSVVVDNTNPDAESRQRYIRVAKENGATCRCFLMNVTFEHAMHNNKFRRLMGADREHKDVNVMVINSYRSKFEQPSVDEGFEEIVHANFVPQFDDERMEKMYGMYLMEK